MDQGEEGATSAHGRQGVTKRLRESEEAYTMRTTMHQALFWAPWIPSKHSRLTALTHGSGI